MVERTDELREDIEERRERIGHTVDEIENRVSPGRVAARTSHRIGQRVDGWKERIMGTMTGDGMAEEGRTLGDAPEALKRQTSGNPLAVGLVAFGGGLLVGSLFPETQAERRAVAQIEPTLREAVPEVKDMGRSATDDVADAVRESVDEMKEAAADSGDRLRGATSPER